MQYEIVNDYSRMEPFKVLLKIVHDTLKKKPATNVDVVRMSDLSDDSLFEPEEGQRVKITLKYGRAPTTPSHLTLELRGEAQKKLSILVDVRVAQDGSGNGTESAQDEEGASEDRIVSARGPEATSDDRGCSARRPEVTSENQIRSAVFYSGDRIDSARDQEVTSENRTESGLTSEDRICSALRELRRSASKLRSSRSVDGLSTAQQEEISTLIHQLIMERFRDELRQIQARISDRRHQIRVPESPEDPQEGDEKMEYDEKIFLIEALGQEDAGFESEGNLLSCYYSTATDRSIGSSNVSTLLSSGGSNTIYSAILPKSMRYRSDTLNEYDIYESIGESTSKEEELIGRIRDEWNVIGQLTNALREYRRRPQVGEGVMIEAERLLLVATYRRDCLTERLCKLDELHDLHGTVLKATVRVSDLAFHLTDKPSKREYFVCLLRGGDQIRSTRTVRADTDGSVRFEEQFTFEGQAAEFDGIELGVYGLVVPKSRKPKRPHHHFAPAVPSFKLRCRTVLRPHHDRLLTERDSPFCPIFTVTVDRTVHVDAHQSGFLSVATLLNGCPVWTRRWCVLDGRELQYWNHPNEETVARPVGLIDLTGLKVGEEKEEVRYGRPRTVALYDGDSTEARYLLAGDTVEEYRGWRRLLVDVTKCFD